MSAKAAYVIIGLLLISFFILPIYIKSVEDKEGVSYVCPPCGCSAHDIKHFEKGNCPNCSMRLIPTATGVKSSYSNYFAPFFKIMRPITPYYHKILYPSYLVAFTLIVISLVNYRKRSSALIICSYLLIFALYAFKHQLYGGTPFAINLSNRLMFLPITFILLSGPLLFLYMKSFNPESFIISKAERLHFVPGLMIFTLSSIVLLLPKEWRTIFIYNTYDSYFNLTEHLLFILLSPYYIVISFKLYRNLQITVTAKRWLQSLFLFHIGFTLSAALLTLINFSLFDMKVTFIDYYFLWFFIAFFIYWSIYFFSDKKGSIFPQSVYNRLSDDLLVSLKEKLDQLILIDKPYLNPNLSLSDLAAKLTITSKELSELLKKSYQQNFYDFINYFRVSEVQQLLLDPNKQNLTNEALAEEAGFKSKSTFMNSFRKITQQTPSEYKRQAT